MLIKIVLQVQFFLTTKVLELGHFVMFVINHSVVVFDFLLAWLDFITQYHPTKPSEWSIASTPTTSGKYKSLVNKTVLALNHDWDSSIDANLIGEDTIPLT